MARKSTGLNLEPYTTVLTAELKEQIKDFAYKTRKSGKPEPAGAEIVRAALRYFFKQPEKKQFEFVEKEISATLSASIL
jgi:hypothetical protein